MLTILLTILVSISIIITTISGVSFIWKDFLHKRAMKQSHLLDGRVTRAKEEKDQIKLKEVVKRRSEVIDRIFRYQDQMSRSNYYLAIGATTFAFIELIKLIMQLTANSK